MELVSHALTQAGRAHVVNEDSFFADDGRGLYVLSDGVGRYRGAATASRCVVESVTAALRDFDAGDARRALQGAVKKAATALARVSAETKQSSMAATLTLAQVRGGELGLAHVGDSRAYSWRHGSFERLTRDHSLAFEQYEAGAITREQLRDHPNQKLLTRTLRGSSTFVVPDFAVRRVLSGDRYLLCTDGLTKALPDDRIAELVGSSSDPVAIGRSLLDGANRAGSDDDVTVIIFIVK
ncbi:MAG TPA: protein phosphatase 2C domain-containing protein [Planctomycetota bacterium]|nr:protein phosphatase 2C domain-containing protein [Planctomycetota bacterium]